MEALSVCGFVINLLPLEPVPVWTPFDCCLILSIPKKGKKMCVNVFIVPRTIYLLDTLGGKLIQGRSMCWIRQLGTHLLKCAIYVGTHFGARVESQ